MKHCTIWLISLTWAAAPALAECVVIGPSPMYLGKNATYELLITVEPQGLCPLFFSSLRNAVHFTSGEISAKPGAGKLSSGGQFNFAYSAAGAGLDQFTLRLCGTVTAGSGCDTLNYTVDVK